MEITTARYVISMVVAAMLGGGVTAGAFVATDRYHAPTPEPLVEVQPTLTPTPTPTSSSALTIGNTAVGQLPSAAAEQEVILRVSRAYAAAGSPTGDITQLTFKLAKAEGNFANVTVTSSTGSVHQYLKKANGYWLVVFEGSATPSADVIATFGIPASIMAVSQ